MTLMKTDVIFHFKRFLIRLHHDNHPMILTERYLIGNFSTSFMIEMITSYDTQKNRTVHD